MRLLRFGHQEDRHPFDDCIAMPLRAKQARPFLIQCLLVTRTNHHLEHSVWQGLDPITFEMLIRGSYGDDTFCFKINTGATSPTLGSRMIVATLCGYAW